MINIIKHPYVFVSSRERFGAGYLGLNERLSFELPFFAIQSRWTTKNLYSFAPK